MKINIFLIHEWNFFNTSFSWASRRKKSPVCRVEKGPEKPNFYRKFERKLLFGRFFITLDEWQNSVP
jgi:hypothetical protein